MDNFQGSPPGNTPPALNPPKAFEIEGVGGSTATTNMSGSSDPFGAGPGNTSGNTKPMTLQADAVPPGIVTPPPGTETKQEPPPDAIKIAEPTKPESVAALNQLPDLSTMQQSLSQSGALMPDLKVSETQVVDNSPLAALQPQHLRDNPGTVISAANPSAATMPSMDNLQTIALANAGLPTMVQTSHQVQEYSSFPYFLLVGLPMIFFIIQGGVQFVHFVLVKYPEYEQLVITNQLLPSDINSYTLRGLVLALLLIFTLSYSVFVFARNFALQSTHLFLAVAIIGLNVLVQNIYLQPYFASGNPLTLPETMREISQGGPKAASTVQRYDSLPETPTQPILK